ncbi:unnamed protein product [Boreogadus saida]
MGKDSTLTPSPANVSPLGHSTGWNQDGLLPLPLPHSSTTFTQGHTSHDSTVSDCSWCSKSQKTFAAVRLAFRKFLPMFDRVLVERLAAETMSKGGIMLPEKAQGKVLQATVVAVGPGSINKSGALQPVCVKVGDSVLLPEYGGTKVLLDDKDYFLFRDADILGKYEN